MKEQGNLPDRRRACASALAAGLAVVLGMASPALAQTAPSECHLVLSFVGANGRPFRDARGNEIRKTVALRDGVSDSLVLSSRSAVPAGQLRAPIRAVVSVAPDTDAAACSQLATSVEIVATAAGWTTVFDHGDGGVPCGPGGEPPAPSPKNEPKCYGMVGLGLGQTAYLNVVVPTQTTVR